MRHSATIQLFASCAIAAVGVAFADVASAQTTSSDALGEVVVTAQKREQNLQEVPLAVTAFNAESLQAQSVLSLTDLNSKVPNVVLAPVGAYPYASAFFIRGLGFADVESTFEPSVGVEMNGVYLARNSGALQDFFDISSVEILRGPQGTLYGRNTIGGVVSVNTKTPEPGAPFSGDSQLTIGDHGRQEARLALNVPLGDVFAARASILYKTYDGFTRNAFLNKDVGDNEVKAGRFTLVAKPNDVFDATLIADIDQERGAGASFRNAALPGNVYYDFSPDTGTTTPLFPAGNSNPSDPYTIYGNTPTFAELDTWGVSLTMNLDTGIGTLTSVTGFREFKDIVQSDYDASPVNFFYALRDQTHEQFSQELRLASNGGGRLDYVVGVYYLDQNYDITNTQGGAIYGGGTAAQIASQENRAYALFGQADYKLAEDLTLTLGGRYSYEEKTFTNRPLFFPVSRTYESNWDNFAPKIGLSYQANDSVLFYGSYSEGFRSGGYNGRAASFTSAGPYNAEIVQSTEFGVKTDLFESRVRLNAAMFSSTYSDMQVGSQGLTSGGIYESIVTNAGKAKIDGVEAEAIWSVGGGLLLNGNISLLNARFEENLTDFTSDGINNPTDNSDLPLAFAPDVAGSFGVTYTRLIGPGELKFNSNAVYMDDIYTSGGLINRTSDVQVRPSHTLYDATLAYEADAGWRVAIWGKNLSNEEVINNTFGLGALGNLRIYQPPRTWAVELGYKF